MQARGERDGQGADQDTQSAQGRQPAAEDDDRVVVAAARVDRTRRRITHLVVFCRTPTRLQRNLYDIFLCFTYECTYTA